MCVRGYPKGAQHAHEHVQRIESQVSGPALCPGHDYSHVLQERAKANGALTVNLACICGCFHSISFPQVSEGFTEVIPIRTLPQHFNSKLEEQMFFSYVEP